MDSVPILENNIHQTMDWIYAIEEECHWDDENQRKAFIALRAVLHKLRDLFSPEDAAQLGAQLPLVIRGIFFEDWKPNPSPDSQTQKKDFLKGVADALYPYRDINVEETTRAVFQVIGEKLPTGAFHKIIKNIPKDIREFYKR